MTDGPERRRARRCQTFEEHGVLSVRVRPGHDVALVNVSAGGALVETKRRLLPGSCVELQLTAASRSTSIRARVLRCGVSMLHASSISYRGAVSFDRDLAWFSAVGDPGYEVPGTDTRSHPAKRAEVTRAAG
jgi:hypothetical protein